MSPGRPAQRFPRKALAAAFATLLPLTAAADAARQDEITLLRAELQRLHERLAALEASGEPTRGAASIEAPEPVRVDAGPDVDASGVEDGTSFGIGGRIHYDVYVHDTDMVAATGGSEFRRVRAQVDGAAAGWAYRVQVELSGRATDLRDVYMEREVGDSTLTIGQFKPFRSMDELTSSNDISLMERGFGSASGLFADRQWQQGVGVLHAGGSGSLGVSLFSLREDNTPRNEGWGTAARATWAPLRNDARLLHLGAWYSLEDGGRGTPATAVEVAYGGRRGPEALLFESAPGSGFNQRTAGVEFAGFAGSFHWQSEWSRASIAGSAGDGDLDAAYLQFGYLFGGVREYDVGDGVLGSPSDIGNGLWEIVARVDRIRLLGGGDLGATRVVLGTNWYANARLRFMLNWTRGEDFASGDRPSQIALRAQYVF